MAQQPKQPRLPRRPVPSRLKEHPLRQVNLRSSSKRYAVVRRVRRALQEILRAALRADVCVHRLLPTRKVAVSFSHLTQLINRLEKYQKIRICGNTYCWKCVTGKDLKMARWVTRSRQPICFLARSVRSSSTPNLLTSKTLLAWSDCSRIASSSPRLTAQSSSKSQKRCSKAKRRKFDSALLLPALLEVPKSIEVVISTSTSSHWK